VNFGLQQSQRPARTVGTGNTFIPKDARIQVDRSVVRAPRSGIVEILRNFAPLDLFNFIVVEYEPRMKSVHNSKVASDDESRCNRRSQQMRHKTAHTTWAPYLPICTTILNNSYIRPGSPTVLSGARDGYGIQALRGRCGGWHVVMTVKCSLGEGETGRVSR
jgi:hypothetical protein